MNHIIPLSHAAPRRIRIAATLLTVFASGFLTSCGASGGPSDATLGGDNASGAAANPSAVAPSAEQDPTVPQPGYRAEAPQAWLQIHNNLLAQAAQGANLVFIGDSITQRWGGEGKAEWNARFAPYGALNLGIDGDQTQQLLWRMDHGALDGFSAKLVVVMIGVNNLWGDAFKNARVAEGIRKVVAKIREKQPGAKVLVLGVLPARQDPASALRAKIKEVNALTAPLDDGKTVRFMDMGATFLEPDGTISKNVMPDYLHLSPQGYKILADAIEPHVTEMLK